MIERIKEVFNTTDKSLNVNEVSSLLSINSVDSQKELNKALDTLEKEGYLYYTNKKKYMLFSKSHLRRGVMNVNKKGFGFLDLVDEDDIFIDEANMNGAIDKDTVIVEFFTSKNSNHKKEGRVLKVVERAKTTFIGEYKVNKKGNGYIVIDDKKIKIILDVEKKNSLNAVAGHKVVAKALKKLDNKRYKGQVISIIGHKDDPMVDILTIALKHEIECEFNKDVVEEVKTIPNEVLKSELVDRLDLREDSIFTIDGEHTKDIDDAVSIEVLDNGNFKLGVHIADVSYYVKEGSALDKTAFERGNSTYLVDSVIPMLPHELSNGICSLNEGVDRLCISSIMEIDPSGNIITYDIKPTVINSKKKMTYEAVNKILEENEIVDGYEEYVEALVNMKKVSTALRKQKIKRGYIEFASNEPEYILDENRKIIEIIKREQKTAEKIIEDFMIISNEVVASHIYNMDLPFVYRIHDKPKEERLKEFGAFVSMLGIQLTKRLVNPYPKDIQAILNELRDRKEYLVLSDMLLRCMQKAVYSKTNIGHYGIASKTYTHFTAPIRRYSDTTVHRLLRKYLFENKIDTKTINYYDEKLVLICEHISEKERASIDAEREVDDMKMAEYMVDHIGEEFEGIVASVMNFGMFIQLDNLVEGLVRVNDLKGDYYVFDQSTMSLVGQSSKKAYRLGDRLKVKVKSASKEERTIDFILV